MSASRDQHFYRFRAQDFLGSVCVDGPYPKDGKEKAECIVVPDGYGYPYPYPYVVDLDWCDPERDEYYTERSFDRHLIGESTQPESSITKLAKEAVGRMAKALHPGFRSRDPEELQRAYFPVAILVQADGLRDGQYYPRVWRPRSDIFEELDNSDHARADARIAGCRLESLLDEIFTVVHVADPKNHLAYGHRTRELLLLACTEVENSWRAILMANHYPEDKLSTQHYVKLKDPLRLREWSLRLADYPSAPTLEPFGSWTGGHPGPSASLPWYDAYNKAKHDRTGGFDGATLWTAVQAVAAAWTMYGAQFGPQWLDEESHLFGVLQHPFEEDTAAGYIAPKPHKPTDCVPKDLPL